MAARNHTGAPYTAHVNFIARRPVVRGSVALDAEIIADFLPVCTCIHNKRKRRPGRYEDFP
jgi:hypothetical protein